MNRILIIILLTAIFSSCEEFRHNLGSGLAISFMEGPSMNSKSAYAIIDTAGATIINAWVLGLDFDCDYVIVQQKPWEILWKDSLYRNYSLDEIFSCIDTSTLRHYWIINKSEERVYNEELKSYSGVYGPYIKDSFYIKRKELGVADSLAFQDVYLCKRYNQYGLD